MPTPDTNNIKIFVATTKVINLPLPAEYQLMMLGNGTAAAPENYIRELTGDTIVEKNPFFCELTGMYYVWKNLALPDYIGFCHYRRYLSFSEKAPTGQNELLSALAVNNVTNILREKDFILSEAYDYKVQSDYQAYAHYHRREDMDTIRRIIGERCPQYTPAFDQALSRRSSHLYNIFITRREIFLTYMEWLFDILLHAEKVIHIPLDDKYQRRLFGFLAERMLDVFITHHNFSYAERRLIEVSFPHSPAEEYSRNVAPVKNKTDTLRLLLRLNGKRLLFCGDADAQKQLQNSVGNAPFYNIVPPNKVLDVEKIAQMILNTPNVAYIFLLPNFDKLSPHLENFGLKANIDFFDGYRELFVNKF